MQLKNMSSDVREGEAIHIRPTAACYGGWDGWGWGVSSYSAGGTVSGGTDNGFRYRLETLV